MLVSIGKTAGGNTFKDELEVNYRFTKNGKAKALQLEAEQLENGNYLVTATAR